MLELQRIQVNYPSDVIETAITESVDFRKEAFGSASLAQIAISCAHVEMDTFLDSLVHDYPELIAKFEGYSPMIQSWTFSDGSIIVYRGNKFTLWQM